MSSPGNQPPKQPLPDQISNAFIKFLIGSGGFSTLALLFMKQVPEALIALIMTGGATLLTSFGQGLMAPLKKVSNMWGTKAGTAVATGADSTLENWSGFYSRLVRVRYRQWRCDR